MLKEIIMIIFTFKYVILIFIILQLDNNLDYYEITSFIKFTEVF